MQVNNKKKHTNKENSLRSRAGANDSERRARVIQSGARELFRVARASYSEWRARAESERLLRKLKKTDRKNS